MVKDKEYNIKLEAVEHIEISRSFSRKVMLKPYEPIDIFSSYTAIMKDGATQQEIEEVSNQLFEKAKADVEKELESYTLNTKQPF